MSLLARAYWRPRRVTMRAPLSRRFIVILIERWLLLRDAHHAQRDAQRSKVPKTFQPPWRLEKLPGRRGSTSTPDDVLLLAFGPLMVCTVCGIIGADARPNWREQAARPTLTGTQWARP
jgi:hypothetical protein